jgi:hypothetical protein
VEFDDKPFQGRGREKETERENGEEAFRVREID